MLEKMVAEMLGVSPAEMQEMLSGMQTLLRDGVGKLNEIHAQNARILALLEDSLTDDERTARRESLALYVERRNAEGSSHE